MERCRNSDCTGIASGAAAIALLSGEPFLWRIYWLILPIVTRIDLCEFDTLASTYLQGKEGIDTIFAVKHPITYVKYRRF